MKHKKLWAIITLVCFMFTLMPVAAFAEEAYNKHEYKRGTTVQTSVFGAEYGDKTAKVIVTVEKDGNTKTVETTVSEGVKYFAKDGTEAITFVQSGEYVIVEGAGAVKGALTKEAEAEYAALDDTMAALEKAVEEKKAALQNAEEAYSEAGEELTAAQVAEVLKKASYDVAVAAYNNAVADQENAQTAYNKAVAALDDVDTAIEKKQAELDSELDELATEEQKLKEAQEDLDNWKTENGYDSQAAINAAIVAKQNEYEKASGLEKVKLWSELTALKALPSVLSGLENAIDSQQAKVDEQKAVVESKKTELENLSDEDKKALLQKDIDEAKAALDTANAEVEAKKAAVDESKAEYDAAVTVTAEAQKKADDAKAVQNNAEAEYNAAVADRDNAANGVEAARKEFIEKLTEGQVTYNPAEISWKLGNEDFCIGVKVYDIVTVKVSDAAPNGAAVSKTEMKVLDGEKAEFTVTPVANYNYEVTNAIKVGENRYSVGPIEADTEVVVKYMEYGKSNIATDISESVKSIAVKSGNEDITGKTAYIGTTLTVAAEAAAGYAIDKILVNGTEIAGNEFIVEAEGVTYTVSATTKFIGATVDFDEENSSDKVDYVKVTVNGVDYSLGEIITEFPAEVAVTVVPKTNLTEKYTPEYITLSVDGEETKVDIVGGVAKFKAEQGKKYDICVLENDVIADSLCSSFTVFSTGDATVEVGVAGENHIVATGETIDNIIPGNPVTVTIKPNENSYVSEVTLNGVVDSEINEKFEKGVKVITFKAANSAVAYSMDVETAGPIIAPNTTEVVIDQYDILANEWEKIDSRLKTGFNAPMPIMEGDEGELGFEYVRGVIAINIFGHEYEYVVWAGLGEEMPTSDELAGIIADEIGVPGISKAVVKMALDNISGLFESFHTFGEWEEETVRAVYSAEENGIYQDTTSAERTVKLLDLRTEVDLDINTEGSVVYGEFTNSDIVAALLEGRNGVVVDGVDLGDEYDAHILMEESLEGANAGTYTVTVGMDDFNLEYRDYDRITVTITVEKADAAVTVDSETIHYAKVKNSGKNASDMIRVNPEADAIEFVVGFGLGGNASANAGTVAYVNLPQLIDVDSISNPIIKAAVEKALEEIGKERNLTASELKAVLEGIVEAADTLDISLSTEAINKLIDILGQIEKLDGVDNITISLTMDKDIVVKDAGVYIVGAVVSDNNYNVTANAGYLAITPDGTKVELAFNVNDENGFITRQAILSGAYDLGSHVVEDGITADVYEGAAKHLHNIYLGIDANGNVTVSNDPSAELGAYTQIAYIWDLGNEMYYAEPIVRAYVVVTDTVTVQFLDAAGNVDDNNAFLFSYDGTPKAVNARAIDRNGLELDKKDLTIRYIGVEGDGEGYYSTAAPSHAGVYTVLATYLNDEQTYMGMAVATMVIAPSMDAEIAVDNAMHIYDGNAVNVSSLITSTPVEAKYAVLTAGIGAASDGTEGNVLNQITGVINIDFPARVDTVLKDSELFAVAYAGGMGVQTVIDGLKSVTDALAAVGYDAEAITNVVDVLNQLNKDVKVTFKEQSEVNPVEVGTYLVVASIFDPDYVPELGAGLVVIAPSIIEAELHWTMEDVNGVVTIPAIANGTYQLDAFATVNNQKDDTVSAAIQYLVLSVDADGNVSLQNLAANELNAAMQKQGVYTEVAYYINQPVTSMTVAAPIMRTLVVVPNAVNIAFKDANNNNAFVFTYDGQPKALETIVTDLNGNAYDTSKGQLTVTYIGADTEAGYYNSTNAPSAIGAYSVIAVYVERDANNELTCAGMTVGAMVIEPADNTFSMEDTIVSYDGTPKFVQVNGDTACIYAVVDDAAKTINIIMPENVTALAKEVKALGEMTVAEAKELAAALKAKIAAGELNEETVAAIGAVATVVDEVQAELKDKAANIEYTVVFNQGKPVEIGTYEVYAMSYGKYVKPVFAQATLTIYDVTVEVDPTALTLTEGETATLTATVTVEAADVNVDTTVTWSSNDTSIATVDANGKVTAVAAGTTTITATVGGKTATCEVTVSAAAVVVTGVSLNKTTTALTVGGEETLVATVAPDNATNKAVTWSSSDTSIVTVDENGKVTAVGAGTATITVTTADGGFTATCVVTVNTSSGGGSNTGSGGSSSSGSSSYGGGGGGIALKEHTAFIGGYPDGTFGPDRQITRGEVAAIFARLLSDKADANKVYTNTFKDVPADLWSAHSISFMQELGYISGYSDGTYRPEQPITRAELVAIVCRVKSANGGEAAFLDVDNTHWAAGAINAAAAKGWVGGYSDGTFRPSQAITRAEVVSILCRMLDRHADTEYITKSYTYLPNTFTDMNSGHWAYWNIMEAANGHKYRTVKDTETWATLIK